MASDDIFVHRLPRAKTVGSRNAFIVERCRGKEVLHLGCVETGRVEEGFEDGSLLHVQLLGVAKRVIGLDINKDGLAYMRRGGVPDLIEWDVERVGELELDRPVEIIVLGEVLEHLANPGLCLRGMHRIMDGAGAQAVITVPNAFSMRRLIPVALKKIELVMPDHVAYYSPTTLSELLGRSGMKVRELFMWSNIDRLSSGKRWVKQALNGTVFRMNPFLAEGIIAIAENA
jgi:2-polyprenyl-3-methyl-5-hydroxy-6-metoxy-1,4-benzoquinol methylase